MNSSISKFDVYPDKAQYSPGEKGNIIIELNAHSEILVDIIVEFKQLHNTERIDQISITLEEKDNLINVPFIASNCEWECFGVDVTLAINDLTVTKKSTAFDVADHWKKAPRYGFLSDFQKGELGNLTDIDTLNKFHINIIQFYDWMYRHDSLVPPTDEFVDPMGRTLSYQVVKEKIAYLHTKGMSALAYGAVYASLKDFYNDHKNWGLYKNNGNPYHLIDIFYIMDISPDSEWNEHIITEFGKVISEGFDGIHMDQYGFPKKAIRFINEEKELTDLAECYPNLINQTKEQLLKINPEVGLIFNNVSNYPVHTTAKANQEAIYIEVWPPVIHLKELKGLIDRGRELGEGKHVILSAYLPTFKPENSDIVEAENGALLTMATIFASGGYHLLLGEENKVLTEAYYPSYGSMREEFIREVRNYYDFIVRYGKLLYDHNLIDLSMTYTGGINTEIKFNGDAQFSPNGDLNTVWTIVKQLANYQVLHLINLVGLEDDYWEHGKKKRPEHQEHIECTVLIEKEVKGVFLVSPDFNSIEPIQLEYEIIKHEHGNAIHFIIPQLQVWDMVYIELTD